MAGGHYHLCVVPLSLVSSESGTGDEYQLLIGRSLSLVRINRGGDLVTKTLCHYRDLGTDVTGDWAHHSAYEDNPLVSVSPY